jgi:ABC-type sugar transport system substrate-binding protein
MSVWRGAGRICARRRRRCGLLALTAVVVMLSTTLAGCVPKDAAVGNTKTAATNVTHDSVDDSDMLIGVVSAGNADADRGLVDAFDSAGVKTLYAPSSPSGKPSSTAPESFEGFISRPVKAIVVSAIDCSAERAASGNSVQGEADSTPSHAGASRDDRHKTDDPQWIAALQSARSAGIPVILVDPVRVPSDDRLYAEILTASTSGKKGAESGTIGNLASSEVMTLTRAVALAVNDNPHPKHIVVVLKP